MQINRRRLFACLAAATVAAVLPPATLVYGVDGGSAQGATVYLPSGGWLHLTDQGWGGFVNGFKAAQAEWEASGLFTPGKLASAGIFSPVRADR